MSSDPFLYVDETHLGRHVTGIERIALELFSADALAPLPVRPIRSNGGTAGLILAQNARLPTLLARAPRAVMLCPGFPPSIPLSFFGRRVVPYIHDCFLITRPQDLNWRARLYMAPAFRRAVRSLPWFLVNSETTRAELARFAAPRAEITLYRPAIRDVFGVGRGGRARSLAPGGRLNLIAIGTVEPRKNLGAAAAIVAALRERHGFDARLDLVGRSGWGDEVERLKALPYVTLHGYQDADSVRALLAGAHAFISTSHDEGLGLSLIEAQYAGLPVVAPDKPVFREVLERSGTFVDTAAPEAAADAIVARLAASGAFEEAAALGTRNIARWNALADGDKTALIGRLARMLGIGRPGLGPTDGDRDRPGGLNVSFTIR